MQRPNPFFQADSASELAAWLNEQYQKTTRLAPTSLFALVDWARLTTVDQTRLTLWLKEANIESINLYDDMKGLALAQSGPRLLEMTGDVLPEVADWSWRTHALSFLIGPVDSPELTLHLQGLREVTLPDGDQALFRFQDINVSSHLFPDLTPGMANQMLGPLSHWVVPDVCGQIYTLTPQPGYKRLGGLRFERRIFDQLDKALLVYTVADQVRDVDAALLQGLTACQIKHLISQRLSIARGLGLDQATDQALYAVLSLQLPAAFESEEPFSTALRQARQGACSFGEAIDKVSPQQWEQWNTKHAN